MALTPDQIERLMVIHDKASAPRVATYSPHQKRVCFWAAPYRYEVTEARTRRHARRAIRKSGVSQSIKTNWLRVA